jgi:hypothetical protein
MMRFLRMNAFRAVFMSGRSRSIRGTCAVAAVLTGLLALSAAYGLSAVSLFQHADYGPGVSTHAKNGATPDWIVELQTRNAGQLPVTVQNDEPSFWI